MIKLENVNYIYKEGNVGLKNINLEIKKGEITAIIGNNGSGKSTILSCIANIIKYKGKISLDNCDIRKINNIELRKQIGIVFQNPNNQIIFNNVYDDIKFTLNNLKLDDYDNRIKKSLKIVKMEDYINSNPYNLSLGQRQRIALASVLSTNPKFLLLDEITSMIDYNGKQDIYDLLQDLKNKGIGIVLGTNIIDELIYADKIIIIDTNHQIKAQLTKKDLLENVNILKENGFNIPFVFKVIDKIGINNLDNISESELIKHVN